MRFNSKALASLSLQTNTKFDKEGVVWMKDKQDGLFKKGEAFVERFCRLKGNMLFYFKNKEVTNADPLGVLIIERCTVELDLDEEHLHGFMLVYEGEENPIHFATNTEDARDQWIQTLHIASYECLKCSYKALGNSWSVKLDMTLLTECHNRISPQKVLQIYLEKNLV